MTKSSKSENKLADETFDGIVTFISVCFTAFYDFFKLFLKRPLYYLFYLALIYPLALLVAKNFWHLRFLMWVFPQLQGSWLMKKIFNLGFEGNFTFLYWSSVFLYILIVGIRHKNKRQLIESNFERVGLKNGQGEVPKVKSIDEWEGNKEIIVRANGVGLDRFLAKAQDLEECFSMRVKMIDRLDGPGTIFMHLTDEEEKTISKFILFSDMNRERSLGVCEFFVGKTKEKTIVQDLRNLPHLLIAGSTGSGKSIFFKQMLLGLIQNAAPIQLYLIDLKGGLEMSDFKEAPNVRIMKGLPEAVAILEKTNREMENRFTYLERKGKKEIESSKDQKDIIVLAIDEAWALYAKDEKGSLEYELGRRARELVDRISKLGRCAGIHLIIATQKVSKETVDTSVQENFTGRMCFKMNSLEGSTRMLGNKTACELPSIPGRGIWNNGVEQMIIQAPHVGSEEIRRVCRKLREMDSEEGILFQEMLGEGEGKRDRHFAQSPNERRI